MSIQPMIVPVYINRGPSHCPECGKVEDIKEVCRHCGHEYKKKDSVMKEVCIIFGILFLILFFSWLICTLVFWIGEQKDGLPTLVDCFKYQLNYLSKLRIW